MQNPNNLVEVQAVFSGHPVPFKNFRAHLLYWLEMTYGTKFAAKTSKALHQKDIEACRFNAFVLQQIVDRALHSCPELWSSSLIRSLDTADNGH